MAPDTLQGVAINSDIAYYNYIPVYFNSKSQPIEQIFEFTFQTRFGIHNGVQVTFETNFIFVCAY